MSCLLEFRVVKGVVRRRKVDVDNDGSGYGLLILNGREESVIVDGHQSAAIKARSKRLEDTRILREAVWIDDERDFADSADRLVALRRRVLCIRRIEEDGRALAVSEIIGARHRTDEFAVRNFCWRKYYFFGWIFRFLEPLLGHGFEDLPCTDLARGVLRYHNAGFEINAERLRDHDRLAVKRSRLESINACN